MIGADGDTILDLSKDGVSRFANVVIGSKSSSCMCEIRFQNTEIVLYHFDEMWLHVGKWQQQMVFDASMIRAIKLGGYGPEFWWVENHLALNEAKHMTIFHGASRKNEMLAIARVSTASF